MNLKTIILPLCVLLIFSCNSFKHVTSVKIVYEPEAQFRPGAAVPFGVVSLDRKGRRKSTKGYAQGKVDIDKYDIKVTGGWQEESNIIIDTLVEQGVNAWVKVLVTVPEYPNLVDSVSWKLTYEGTVSWYFNGVNGEKGKKGKVRIVSVRIGGTSLSDGNDGQKGYDGGNGHDLDIYVAKMVDSAFIQRHHYNVYAVKVVDRQTSAVKLTYVQETFGRLNIYAEGGKGGDGGDGGPGPDGRTGDATHSPGDGADGGRGGNGGTGGQGGKVRIFIDTANKAFLTQLIISNKGGAGGAGGTGGRAGQGGSSTDGRRGSDGRSGSPGFTGQWGRNGGEPEIIYGPVSLQ